MTSKQLLLHIGTGKTGTTSIQESLYRAAVDGLPGDICYPLAKGRNHNFLAALYMAPERLPREYRGRYETQGPEALQRDASHFRRRLFQAIEANDRIIISAEYLGRLGPEEIQTLRKDLAGVGVSRVRIVAYIRDPASAYLSFVQQTLKAATIFRAPAAYHYPFRQVLEGWSEEFPDVVVRPFAKDSLVGGDIVRDFETVASTFFGIGQPLDLPVAIKNQSVSAEAMIVLQRYRRLFYSMTENQFQWDSGELLRLLQESMQSVRQTRAVLLPWARRAVARRHLDDVEWLRTNFGVRLPEDTREFSARKPSPSEAEASPRYLDDVTLILESYDPDIVNELTLHCLRRALEERRSSASRLSKVEPEVSELEQRLKDCRRDEARVRQKLQRMEASHSWRWGRRLVFIASAPRRLISALRRE